VTFTEYFYPFALAILETSPMVADFSFVLLDLGFFAKGQANDQVTPEAAESWVVQLVVQVSA
jgi:hypothetical protein